jgi:alpha-beta hydrolase superfamily lysophospholipase
VSTPTDEQQIRATLRRAERNHGTEAAAVMAVAETVGVLGIPATLHGLHECDGLIVSAPDVELPPLLGAQEAADILGMKATNLKRLSPPLPVAAVVSGRIPVYREADVLAKKAERDARRAAA